MKSIYLAGPDVFYPDARERGQRMKDLCLEHGYVGLYPLDTVHDCDSGDLSRSIFEANCQLIDRADAVLGTSRSPGRGRDHPGQISAHRDSGRWLPATHAPQR